MAFPTGWTYKRKVVVDNTKVSGSSNLTDFPMLLDQSMFDASSLTEAFANSQGKEINSNYLLSDANQGSYYRLESDGTDEEANNTLTAVNTPTFSTAKFGNGVVLNGSNQYLYKNSPTVINITGSQTWSAWVKFDTITGSPIIASIHDGTNYKNLLLSAGSNPTFQGNGLTTNTSVSHTNTVVVGQWHHIAGVYDSVNGKLKVFLDGVKTEVTATGSFSANTGPFNIGSYNNGSGLFLDGTIDDVDIFTRALADHEIESIYRGGADVRFTTDEAGTDLIPHEMVNWDIDNSECEVHVRIPTLNYNTDTTIYIWYGNSTADQPFSSKQIDDYSTLRDKASLKGYWKLESDGTDETANNNDLTASGSPTHVSSILGNGVDLELSSSQYYSITDASQTGLDLSTDFTFSAWVKLEQLPSTAGSNFSIISKDNVSVDRSYGFIILSSNNKLRCIYLDNSENFTAFDMDEAFDAEDVGVWVHLACAVDISAQTATFYKNGISKTYALANAGATTIKNSASDFMIGARKSSGTAETFFDGVIDDVGIWTEILTAEEIRRLYNDRTAVWGSEYKGVFHADDVNDSTSNQHNLTNTNNVGFAGAKIGDGADFGTSNTNKDLRIDETLDINGGIITLQAWVKARSEIGSGTYTIIDKSENTNDIIYRLEYEYNGGTRRLRYARTKSSVADADIYHNVTLGTTNFYKIDLTYDNTDLKAFLDGSQVESSLTTSGNGSAALTDRFIVGGGFNLSNYGSFYVDEFRILNVARSADWIATEYNNQNSPSTFATVSSVAITRSLSSAVSLADSLDKQSDYSRTLLGTISLADAINNASTYRNNLISALSITDANIDTAINITIYLTDSVNITDAGLDQVLTATRNITDTLNITDVIARDLIVNRNISDGVTVTDTLTFIFQVTRNLTDSVSVGDSLDSVLRIVTKLIAHIEDVENTKPKIISIDKDKPIIYIIKEG